MQSLISVIVPVYKVPLEYLRECFDSLLVQTMQECEFIVVSDGAPDAECSVCEEYAAKDSRFKFFRREHAGVSATRNFGISQAQGEYITFVDSDDWIEPNCCEDLFNYALENNSDVVLFDYIPEGLHYKKIPYSGKSIDQLCPDEINNLQKQCIRLTEDRFVGAVSTSCKFVKKDLLLKHNIHFPTNVKRCEDRLVSYGIFTISKKTSYLRKYLYHYQCVDTSITHSIQKTRLPTWLPYLTEIKIFDKKHSQLIANHALSSFFYSIGKEYFVKTNTSSLYEKILELRSLVKSKDFQWTIKEANLDQLKGTPFIIKFDSFFVRRKIMLPIWLHAIKWKIFGS